MESRVAVFKGQRKERSSEGTMEPILFPHDIRHSVWLFTPVLIDPGSRSRQISGTFSTGKMSFFSKKKTAKSRRKFLLHFSRNNEAVAGNDSSRCETLYDELWKKYNWESLTTCFEENLEEGFVVLLIIYREFIG